MRKNKSKQKVDVSDQMFDYISNADEPLLLEETIKPYTSIERKNSKGLKKCMLCSKNIQLERHEAHKKLCEQADRRSYQGHKPNLQIPKQKKPTNFLQNRNNKIGFKLYSPKTTYNFDF